MREATGAERLFWSEVMAENSNRRSVALCYAALYAAHLEDGPDFWRGVNNAVISRFKIRTQAEFDAFQQKAKSIYVAAANVVCPAFPAPQKEEAANAGPG